MKREIAGIFVCMLLIAATVLPVAGNINSENNTSYNNEINQNLKISAIKNSDCNCKKENNRMTESTGIITPNLEKTWTGAGSFSEDYNQVMSTPLVADLDGDANPEIIFNSYNVTTRDYWDDAILRAVHATGTTCTDYFPTDTVPDTTFNRTCGLSTPAIGDINRDGLPEIVVPEKTDSYFWSSRLIAYDNTGRWLWTSDSLTGADRMRLQASPAIAHLDLDVNSFFPMIVVGNKVFSHNGRLLDIGTGGTGLDVSCVADVDVDGYPEIVAGHTVYAYSISGGLSIKYDDASLGDGYTAIADFDTDVEKEIVLVVPKFDDPEVGDLYLLDHDLTVIDNIPLLDTGGGPPTIEDFDGDGLPEIGVETKLNYTVYNYTAGVLGVAWNQPISDLSTGAIGSTVFDFDVDHAMDVIFNDDETLRVFDGRSGAVVWQTPNPSGTGFEMPTVADVDDDGHAEFVVVCNQFFTGHCSGIKIFGDDNNWTCARKIWNQHTYHITNVWDNGMLPRLPWIMVWPLMYNNYRVQSPCDLEFNCSKEHNASDCIWPGDVFWYFINFSNPHSVPLTNVYIQDQIPDFYYDLDLSSCSSSCPGAIWNYIDPWLTIEIPSVDPHTTCHIRFKVKYNPPIIVPGGSVIKNVAYIEENQHPMCAPECTIQLCNRDPDPPQIHTENLFSQTKTIHFYAIDPDGLQDEPWLYYYIDWGDGTFKDWFGLYKSGEEVQVEHTWGKPGFYMVKVKAKDFYGAESDWGKLLVVTPVNQQSAGSQPLLLQFLQRFLGYSGFSNTRRSARTMGLQ